MPSRNNKAKDKAALDPFPWNSVVPRRGRSMFKAASKDDDATPAPDPSLWNSIVPRRGRSAFKEDTKDEDATSDPSIWTTIIPRRGRSRLEVQGKDNDATPDPPPPTMAQDRKGKGRDKEDKATPNIPPPIMSRKGKGKGKDKEDNATPDIPPPTMSHKDKGKDKDNKDAEPSKSLPQRLPIPRVDDVTKHLVESTINSVEFDELVEKAGSYESAIVLLGRCLHIDVESMKALFKDGLVSFSNARYRKIAPLFNMSPEYDSRQWKSFTIPRVSLPNSVKEALLNAGVRAYKQSGAPSLHANEHVRVRFIGAWLSILISLFDGCVFDIPEQPMPGTNTSTGGKVEYELFMWQRTVVLVIELKYQLGEGEALWNQLAQVMCELDSACQMNRRISLQDFPIYAILADGKKWHFIAFDGTQNQFYMDSHIEIPCSSLQKEDHVLYIRSMIEVCNRIFGMLLQGYINTLKAYEDKSIRRGLIGDETKLPSSSNLPIPIPDSERPPIQRGSTKTWETRVTDILECQGKFERAFRLFSKHENNRANEYAETGYRQLQNCVRSMEVQGGIDTYEVRNMIKRWKEKGDPKIDV